MSKHTVVVCDHIHESGLEILKTTSDINYVYAADIDKIALLDVIKDADVCITRSSTDVDQKFLDAATNLKAVVRAGVGYDNVDMEGCSKQGVIAMNVPTANTLAATELTMTHMLSCMRKMPYAHAQLKDQRIWKREDWYGQELFGKKLGVIGFGNIGHRVALRAKGFEMNVVTYDPYIDSSKATDLDVTYTTNFDDILDCDIITIHTPKNEETLGMISEEEIAKMKDGVILINCARGGLYDEKALFNNLQSGKIAMAGIDVFNKEPAIDNPLLDLPNIIVTAHLGANTVESQLKIATQAAENAIEAARGIGYPHALNLPIDESKIPAFVKPYLELTQKMAFLIAQMDKSAIKSIKIEAEGEIGDYLDSLNTFATVGALTTALSNEKINYVNATFIADEKNIKLDASKVANNSGYKNKVTVKITTTNGVNSVSGTIFNEDVQRIIAINNFIMDIEPSGKMILVTNSDIPGVIGEVGKTLGDSSINISDFRLGRNDAGALAVILVDNEVTKETLTKLENLEAATSVCFVKI
ncbi:MAG: phosphoglycerate dehydrogenase [Campylobacteraceae bacterium]|jgi:D-3-phosphoglycerate dehydrogenase|nr:phosphoglycerate dehydrogenase [Campylobacteraceae bacterium]MBT4030633.1 phosphoglycerate dehydrogenase [Campylobacteraceae bacterium]MBT4178787.1 phosphoglycerate dehydrogenase [Campylobacteraceae bacterium]MBT4571948.1 phosphoglycerate dehydrogenase [Campylobacteraceae bacterium]MBT4707731.1 phosphoglycerate dehydrogenase [Campylobacteraceae bacterium]